MVLLASLSSFMVNIPLQVFLGLFMLYVYSLVLTEYGCLGSGMAELSLADRATIANMSPEYGATMGFFPVDHVTLQYLKLTGRSDETVSSVISVYSFLCFQQEKFRCFLVPFCFKLF